MSRGPRPDAGAGSTAPVGSAPQPVIPNGAHSASDASHAYSWANGDLCEHVVSGTDRRELPMQARQLHAVDLVGVVVPAIGTGALEGGGRVRYDRDREAEVGGDPGGRGYAVIRHHPDDHQ